MVANERVQLFAWCGLGGQCIECLLLALCGHGHAFAHHGIEQRAFAFEVVEGRAAVHARRRRNVARAGGGKALSAEEFGSAVHEFATAVAVVEFFGGLAGAAAGAAGGGFLSRSCIGCGVGTGGGCGLAAGAGRFFLGSGGDGAGALHG